MSLQPLPLSLDGVGFGRLPLALEGLSSLKLNPLALALQGIGFGSVLTAWQGFDLAALLKDSAPICHPHRLRIRRRRRQRRENDDALLLFLL